MKKGFLFSAIIIVILLTHNVAFGEDSIKVGLVDIQRCLDESKEGQKVLELLKRKKGVLQRQLDTKQRELLKRNRDGFLNQAECHLYWKQVIEWDWPLLLYG